MNPVSNLFLRESSMRVKVIFLMSNLVMVYTMNNCVVDGKYPKGYLTLFSSNSTIPVNAYVTYGTGSHQQASTTELVHDSKNSFKFIAAERSFDGQYKLEEGKNNRGFIISTENGILDYKA